MNIYKYTIIGLIIIIPIEIYSDNFQWKKEENQNIINIQWKSEEIKEENKLNKNIYIYNEIWDKCQKSYWECELLENWNLKWNRIIKVNWDVCIWREWNCEIITNWEIRCDDPDLCSIEYTNRTQNNTFYTTNLNNNPNEDREISNKCVINYLDQYEKLLLKSIIYKKLKDKINSENNLEDLFSEAKNISKYTQIKKNYFNNKISEIDNSDKKSLFIINENIEDKYNLNYIDINQWNFLLHKSFYLNKNENSIQKYVIKWLSEQLKENSINSILEKNNNKLFSSTYKDENKNELRKIIFQIISKSYKKFLESERYTILEKIIQNCTFNKKNEEIMCNNKELFTKLAKTEILFYILENTETKNSQIQKNINNNPDILLENIKIIINNGFSEYKSWKLNLFQSSDIKNLCWKINLNELELNKCKKFLLNELNQNIKKWIFLNNQKISLININEIDKKINIKFFVQKIESLYKKYIIQDAFFTKFYDKFNETWAIIQNNKIKYPEWFIEIIKDKNCDSINNLKLKEQDNTIFFINWENIIFNKAKISLNSIKYFYKEIAMKNYNWENIMLKTNNLKYKINKVDKKEWIFAKILDIKNKIFKFFSPA